MFTHRLRNWVLLIATMTADLSYADNTCAIIFQGENFSDASWFIQANTQCDDMTGAMISRRKWRGTLRKWSGEDVNWNDQVRSIQVMPNCKLAAFENIRFDGARWLFKAADRTALFPKLDNPGVISSFSCSCNDIGKNDSPGSEDTSIDFIVKLPRAVLPVGN